MSMQMNSTSNSTYNQPMIHAAELTPKSVTQPNVIEELTPEELNNAKNTIDDKMTEQVNNVKGNYQTAKDHDLMNAYYDQQQKLLDIYMQTETEDSTSISTQADESTSAVSALTSAYSELYQLHQGVKDGISNLPSIDQKPETLPEDNEVIVSTADASQAGNTLNSTLSNKQLDSYNSLMMPITSNYVHLSA